MKLKVIFLKKKQLYTALGILILILLCLFFLNLKSKTTVSTFNIMSKDKIFKTDVNGDGEDDFLYVKSKDNKYYLQVNTKDNKTIFLEPEKKLGTLGFYYEYWPMRITLKDINRDAIPEIFIQASQKNKPIQHVFMWQKDNFKDVFCSYNNILGFMDYSNSRTPKFISGNYKDNKINFTNYILIGKDLKAFDYKCDDSFMGKDSISYFISFTNNLFSNLKSETNTLNEIIFKENSSPTLDFLTQISDKTSSMTFQDAFFKDSKYDKSGNISEITWLLNFKGTLKENNEIKNYTFVVTLKPSKTSEEKFKYKLSRISLSQLK